MPQLPRDGLQWSNLTTRPFLVPRGSKVHIICTSDTRGKSTIRTVTSEQTLSAIRRFGKGASREANLGLNIVQTNQSINQSSDLHPNRMQRAIKFKNFLSVLFSPIWSPPGDNRQEMTNAHSRIMRATCPTARSGQLQRGKQKKTAELWRKLLQKRPQASTRSRWEKVEERVLQLRVHLMSLKHTVRNSVL